MATALYGQALKWLKTTADMSLVPRGRRPHPFARVVREMESPGGDQPESDEAARATLRAFFVAMPEPMMRSLTPQLMDGYEALIQAELAAGGGPLPAESLFERKSPAQFPVAVWRGDMTKLKVGAMVNPANGDLLGCFLPSHRCLDNILHAQSGARLRLACQEMKSAQKIDIDDNGMCRVTPAYALPAQFVFHTVGPNLVTHSRDGEYIRPPTDVDRAELTSCYEKCLGTASEMGLPSIAFCCISTGVFGYPADEACDIAMSTVKRVMERLRKESKPVPLVIFNVFKPEDHVLYLDVLEKHFPVVSSSAAAAAATEGDDAGAEDKKKEEEKKTTTTASAGEEKKDAGEEAKKKDDDKAEATKAE